MSKRIGKRKFRSFFVENRRMLMIVVFVRDFQSLEKIEDKTCADNKVCSIATSH